MGSSDQRVMRLEFTSAVEMVDFVQVVADHVGRDAGLDPDSVYWMGLAVRECVVNAITHGNQGDEGKYVHVDFATKGRSGACELMVCVRDEGEGFDPEMVADPLAPENILKGSGRGIFLVKHFMDEVLLRRAPEGGMEVRMTKRVQAGTASDGPREA